MFGLRYPFLDYLVDFYKNGFTMDLSVFNDDASCTLIGTDGVIADAEVSPDYTKRPDPSELLPARPPRRVARRVSSRTHSRTAPNHPFIPGEPYVPCRTLRRTEAKLGKEEDVAAFLASAQSLAAAEPDTVAWFAVRLDTHTFAVFGTFDHEAGREAHMNGRIAEALKTQADALFAVTPQIRRADVLADKLPA